jgi:hypothetical protein
MEHRFAALRVPTAALSLVAVMLSAGCASSSRVAELEVDVCRMKGDLVSLRTDLIAQHDQTAARLARALVEVNAGRDRAVAEAQRLQLQLEAQARKLDEMAAVFDRYRVVKRGDMYFLAAANK